MGGITVLSKSMAINALDNVLILLNIIEPYKTYFDYTDNFISSIDLIDRLLTRKISNIG
jgi:hypothetical protein